MNVATVGIPYKVVISDSVEKLFGAPHNLCKEEINWAYDVRRTCINSRVWGFTLSAMRKPRKSQPGDSFLCIVGLLGLKPARRPKLVSSSPHTNSEKLFRGNNFKSWKPLLYNSKALRRGKTGAQEPFSRNMLFGVRLLWHPTRQLRVKFWAITRREWL